MTRRALLPLTVLVVAAALAAGATSASAAPAAGPSAWAKAANAICAKTQDRIQGIPRGSSLKETITGFGKILDIVIQQNRDLAKLQRPKHDAAAIAKLLGYYETQVGFVRAMLAGMKKGDQAAVNAASASGSQLNSTATALARTLGAGSC